MIISFKTASLKSSITRRGRRLRRWFLSRLNRESLLYQTTLQSASEALMAPSYGLILQNTDKICRKTQNAYPIFLVFVCVFIPNGLPKTIHNSAWSTPSELIFASFESWESPLSNDSKISVWDVDHAELWIDIAHNVLWNITPWRGSTNVLCAGTVRG